VVVTHHVPCREGAHPDYDGLLTCAFVSDLMPLMAAHPIDLWIWGHTHANLDLRRVRLRMVSNQRGYPEERLPGPEFDPAKVVEVGR